MSQAGYLSFTRLGFNKDLSCVIHYLTYRGCQYS